MNQAEFSAVVLSELAQGIHKAKLEAELRQALDDELYSYPRGEVKLKCGCLWKLVHVREEGEHYTEHSWQLCETHEGLEP